MLPVDNNSRMAQMLADFEAGRESMRREQRALLSTKLGALNQLMVDTPRMQLSLR